MARFLARRIAQGVAIIFVVATLTFLLLHLAPGDPFTRMMLESSASASDLEGLREHWGLNRSIPAQYVTYLKNVARLDFGISFWQYRPVTDVLRDHLPPSILLAVTSLIFMFGVGILLGAIQGARAGSVTDRALSLGTVTLFSVPIFWLGVVLVYVFAEVLGIFPAGGMTDPMLASSTFVGTTVDRLHRLVLPTVTLGLVGAAGIARYQRAAMVDVVRQDFVRGARAKGLTELRVFARHALRNALLPIVTLFGLYLPILISGTVLIEKIFNWPGLGRTAYLAVQNRDYTLVTGITIVTAAIVVGANLISDILYRVVDPRTAADT